MERFIPHLLNGAKTLSGVRDELTFADPISARRRNIERVHQNFLDAVEKRTGCARCRLHELGQFD